MTTITRRSALLGGGLATASLLTIAPAMAEGSVNPFTLGVASGDPTPDGMVLWTRLAVDPLAADGLGGMGSREVPVEWELSRDATFTKVERRGRVMATAQWGHSVHVEPTGLASGRPYWYRFRADGHLSRVGMTRTAPAAGASPGLTLAMASCAQWEHGFFTAYRRIAEEMPDLVVHLGDYIYEHGPGGYPVGSGRARTMVGGEIYTLADYRRRHALYKSDPDLQLVHARAPWLVVFDDHEVDNDWASLYHELWGATPSFRRRRAAGFQAYYENMPLRRSAMPIGPDMQLFRRITWGRTANLHLMDTRQYRSNQACGGLIGPCRDVHDPSRSITGGRQEQWLLDGMASSQARWDLLGQQVMFAQHDLLSGPGFITSADTWDGYVASRSRVLQGFVDTQVRNPVVLTGDIHEHFAADLQRTEEGGKVATLGSEIVTSSITSGGDSGNTHFDGDRDNPHIRYTEQMRGYAMLRLTAAELRADFRVLDRVSSPGAPARTDASFVVEDRARGLQAV